MSAEEIEEERRQILERFGAGIGDVLAKAKQNRLKRASEATRSRSGTSTPLPPPVDIEESRKALQNLEEVPISPEDPAPSRARSPPPPALVSAANSRPPSRSSTRRLRFAELDPKDVYVYESHPPSPKRVLALPPPTENDKDAVSLGTWHGVMKVPSHLAIMDTAAEPEKANIEGDAAKDASMGVCQAKSKNEEPEEGTPEYIRRRFFPDRPANDPGLAWISQSEDGGREGEPPTALRFNLHGNPIPPKLSSHLPTSLGLHHHAEGSHAGYTLEDIFLLTRSSVPAQRTIMYGILAGVARNLSKMKRGDVVPYMDELKGQEEELRKRIVAAGAEAINERGSVGLRAVELVWECVVAWDRDLIVLGLEGVWLESEAAESIRSLSLEYLLPSFSDMFNQIRAAYPHETLLQVLEIVQRLALENRHNAKHISGTDKLLSGIVQYFLLSPSINTEGLHSPDPSAISLLIFLARASRETAHMIAQSFADDLLRFIAILPEASPFPVSLANSLMARTLRFYATLGAYGLCTGIASTAMEQIPHVSRYACLSEQAPSSLSSAWAQLAEVWITCGVDPHVTTPPHDITWSRISAWAWQGELLGLLERIDAADQRLRSTWGHAWGALAAWLEGCRVNGVRGGEKERADLLQAFGPSFEAGGRASKVISLVLDSLTTELQDKQPLSQRRMKTIASNVEVLRNAIRLWLSLIPPHVEGPPETPPFILPFDRISTIAAALLSSPIWGTTQSSTPERYFTIYLRHVSTLLSQYLSLSRRLPAVTRELWLGQAFSLLLRFMPGDEDAALTMIDQIFKALAVEMNQHAESAAILKPFIVDAVLSRAREIEPDEDDEAPPIAQQHPRTRLAPLVLTSSSIPATTTDILLSPFAGPKSQRHFSGLPLNRDWTLTAMDHLLHSGESPVFRHLPSDWDFSEVDVTRSSLAFALTSREYLNRFGLEKYAIDRNEVILGCMKVFMLEHGLEKDAVVSSEEVFRDKVVETHMERLLVPYRHDSSTTPEPLAADLEMVATRFLGTGTPFYQFYTDFVGLYDAISFSHPLFGLLLLPPISMQYAIDYRKLFWCDYPQILRTISVLPNQVLSKDLGEYLYPVESEPQVIGSLLSALVKNGATGFLRWIAVHHVAANVWKDLRDEGVDGTFNEERGVKLLKAIVDRGDKETIREVVNYRQGRRSRSVRLPPDCFCADQDVLGGRKQWIEGAVGMEYAERLAGLLATN